MAGCIPGRHEASIASYWSRDLGWLQLSASHEVAKRKPFFANFAFATSPNRTSGNGSEGLKRLVKLYSIS